MHADILVIFAVILVTLVTFVIFVLRQSPTQSPVKLFSVSIGTPRCFLKPRVMSIARRIDGSQGGALRLSRSRPIPMLSPEPRDLPSPKHDPDPTLA